MHVTQMALTYTCLQSGDEVKEWQAREREMVLVTTCHIIMGG